MGAGVGPTVGVIFHVDIEGGEHCGRVDPVVVCKLCHGDLVHPVILVMIDVESQVLFQLLVHPLCLPICLQVVGCGRVVLNPQELVKADRKLGLEL